MSHPDPTPLSDLPETPDPIVDPDRRIIESRGERIVPALSESAIRRAESHNPDGAPADPSEFQRVPRLLVVLAVMGIIVVAGVLGSTGDWRAALLGIVWLILGYAVSWSVVWVTGLIRAREEREITEEHIIGHDFLGHSH